MLPCVVSRVVSHVVPRVVSLLCASRSGLLAVHVQTRETYGPLRMQPELASQGFEAGRDRITGLRRELGLRCKQKRKFETWSVPVWFSADSETSADEQPVTWDSHAPVSTGLTSC